MFSKTIPSFLTLMLNFQFGHCRALTSLIMFSIALPIPAFAQGDGNKFAIVVGIEEYQHEYLRTPPLKFSVEDAAELKDELDKAGYQVVLLTDDSGRSNPKLKPTKSNIERELKALLKKCRRQDTVIVAFAGHGMQFENQKDAFFCPSDARPFESKTNSMVSMKFVFDEMESSFAGVRILLVDACRNDPDPGRGRDGLNADSTPRPPRGVAALYSCGAGQKAFEHDSLKHGVFFHHLLEGIKGKAARGNEITFDDLSQHVRRHVPATTARLFPGRSQSPNLKADLMGVPPVLVNLANSTIKPLEAPFGKQAINNAIAGYSSKGMKRSVSNDLGMRFNLIPAGKFMMGSPSGEEKRGDDEFQHEVEITEPFYMGVFEVTQSQWKRVMGKNPSYFSKLGDVKEKVAGINTDSFPVESVSWDEIQVFLDKLNEDYGVSGFKYDLPTEAQWEYACRAGTSSPFHFGSRLNGDRANHDGNYPYGTETKGEYLERPTAVGSYSPNAFGLYDMHGNVSEWCRDWYSSDYYKTSPFRDPVGPKSGSSRVLRGGSWIFNATRYRSANRYRSDPTNRNNFFGFRVVLSR